VKLASDFELQDQILHERVVNEIAEHRFGLPEWQVTTMPARLPSEAGWSAIPDIVATHGDAIVAVGEVAVGNICSEQALHWKELGKSCVRFYLYVPDDMGAAACQLISEHEIVCAGVRTYKYNGKLEIEALHLDEVRCQDDDHPWWVGLGGGGSSC
jgi:hypothetical protein